MRRLLVLPLLVLVPVGSASAATLPYNTAAKRAHRAGASEARRSHAVAWEVSKGFRFARHKLVFGWYGERADGTACDAQLVVRYASLHSRRIVTYFRRMECG
jgi:hypothetical protein